MIATHASVARGRLRDELVGQSELDGGGRCQTDRPRLGRPALEVAVPLEDLQVVVDSRGGGEADRPGDLAHRRWIAARTQRRRDEVEDLDLAFGVVFRHSRLLCPQHSERMFDVKASPSFGLETEISVRLRNGSPIGPVLPTRGLCCSPRQCGVVHHPPEGRDTRRRTGRAPRRARTIEPVFGSYLPLYRRDADRRRRTRAPIGNDRSRPHRPVHVTRPLSRPRSAAEARS